MHRGFRGRHQSSMLCSKLHVILGAGGDDVWAALPTHSHSFLYAAVDETAHVVSLHELTWDVRKPRCTASGALGWVKCRQSYGPGAPLPVGDCFRVHVCKHDPMHGYISPIQVW